MVQTETPGGRSRRIPASSGAIWVPSQPGNRRRPHLKNKWKKKNKRNPIELELQEAPSCQGKSPLQGRVKEREKSDRRIPK